MLLDASKGPSSFIKIGHQEPCPPRIQMVLSSTVWQMWVNVMVLFFNNTDIVLTSFYEYHMQLIGTYRTGARNNPFALGLSDNSIWSRDQCLKQVGLSRATLESRVQVFLLVLLDISSLHLPLLLLSLSWLDLFSWLNLSWLYLSSLELSWLDLPWLHLTHLDLTSPHYPVGPTKSLGAALSG